jgi:hypothetical protein
MKIKTFWQKYQKIILIFGGVFLILVIGGIIFYFYQKKNSQNPIIFFPQTKNNFQKEEEKFPCPFTGQLVSKNIAVRWPLAVIVENHPDARPQSGLQGADIVYEALAEGGITRFLAIFHCQDVDEIGPVRSLRPYYLVWASQWRALLAYIGGSPTALKLVEKMPVYNFNQFFNSQYYWRDKKRPAPHNVYTSTEKLWIAAKEKFSLENYSIDVFKFHKENPPSQPQNQKIEINYSFSQFKVLWEYSSQENAYLRYQGGKPFKDKVGDRQITAKNVVVMWVKAYPEENGSSRLKMDLVGEGRAYIFSEGKLKEGVWRKQSETGPTLFYDKNGNQIEFIQGNIWIQVVPQQAKVSVL